MIMANYTFDREEVTQIPFDLTQFVEDMNPFQTMKFDEQSFKNSEQEARD